MINYTMKEVNTFQLTVVVGLRAGYSSKIFSLDFAKSIIQGYCNEVKLGVTVTESTCIYVDGSEPCVQIGFINYPRFPKDTDVIRDQAKELGLRLAMALEQERFTIVGPDFTRMFELKCPSPETQDSCPARDRTGKVRGAMEQLYKSHDFE